MSHLWPAIRDAFRAPFQDPKLLEKMLRVGVWLFVPFFGWLALLGWQRRVYETRALPDPDFGADILRGLPVFFAIAVVFAIPGIPLALAAIALTLANMRVSGFLPEEIVEPIFFLWLFVTYPIALRIALTRSFSVFGEIVRDPLLYLAIAAAMFVAYLLSVIGINFCCCIGICFTGPLGHAIAANLIRAWAGEPAGTAISQGV